MKKQGKRIKSERSFAAGIIMALLSAAAFAAAWLQQPAARFAVAGVLALAYSAVSFLIAFTEKGAAEQAAAMADERDRYIAQKSGQAALRLSNYILWGGCMLCLLLYAVSKNGQFLSAGIALCAALVVLFLTVLFANLYYETRE